MQSLDSPCIEHDGALINTGYGKVRKKGKNWLAHRFAWTQVNGEIPSGMCVCHKCDNRKCVNVLHLFLGTRSDNMKDMIRKGRDKIAFKKTPPVGELNANAILTKRDVFHMRRLRAMGIKRKRLSNVFGCSVSAVDHVIYGHTWL